MSDRIESEEARDPELGHVPPTGAQPTDRSRARPTPRAQHPVAANGSDASGEPARAGASFGLSKSTGQQLKARLTEQAGGVTGLAGLRKVLNGIGLGKASGNSRHDRSPFTMVRIANA
jgi:hypothetical protein